MKKLSTLAAAIIVTSVLTACGTDSSTIMQPLAQTPANQVSTMSAKGLNSFYNSLIERVFKKVDANSDKRIDAKEYENFRFFLGQGQFGYMIGGPLPSEPVDAPAPVAPAPEPQAPITTAAKKIQYTQDFSRVDKNKDKKLTLTEAKASYYFLGATKQDFRTKFIRPALDIFDLNKDTVVTVAEFNTYLNSFPAATDPAQQQQIAMMKQSFRQLFVASDRNFDNRLTFSEFEDLIYNTGRAADMDTSQPAPTPAPPSEDPGQPDPNPVPAEPTQPAPPAENPDQPVADPDQPAQP